MTPKRVCSEGLRRVPVSTGAQFSLLQPNPKRAPKWEPKWSVLGAKVVTILLFVRPCRENRPSKSFNFFDMISEHLSRCAGARGGLARPEGGYCPGKSPHSVVFVFRNRRPRSCLFVHFVFVFLFSIPPATGYKTSFGGSFGLTFDDSGGRLVSLGESFGLTFEAYGDHLGSILRSWEVIGTQFRRPWAQRVSKAI